MIQGSISCSEKGRMKHNLKKLNAMKKVLFFSFFVVILMLSCQTAPQSVLTEKTVTVVQPQFFYLCKEVVVNGDNCWNLAKVYLGIGLRWTDIIKQNPFMQEPGRVWKNEQTGIWYALIKPGETLIIGQTEINPTFVEFIDTPANSTPQKSEFLFLASPWWWFWLVIAIIILALLLAVVFNVYRANNTTNNNSSASVHVNIRDGIDLDTRRTLLVRDQEFRDRTLRIVEEGAQNGRLKGFFINTNPESFTAAGSFRGAHKPEVPKEEDKK